MKESGLVPTSVEGPARSAGRGRFGFGPRFFLLLMLGLLWLGPAWWNRQFLLGLLVWDLLALAVWAWDFRRIPEAEQLIVARRWNSPLALGSGSEVEISLRNEGSVAVWAFLEDDTPTSLCHEPPVLEAAAPPGSSALLTYPVSPLERGDVKLGKVHLRCRTVLQVAERWFIADLEQTVRVYPNLEEAKRHKLHLIRSRQIEIERRLQRQRGLGREFDSLREYRSGDELRDVCWTASARRGKLITKTYQKERSQTLWLVVDAGRLLRARCGELMKLDYIVTAAVTLAQIALFSGDRVGLLAYGRKLQQQIGPGRGPLQIRTLVERLAVVRGEPSEANHLAAAGTLLSLQKRRSLIVWLTDLAETAATPEVIEGASRMTPRHLVLFVVISNPELTQLAALAPGRESEMYRVMAAQEMAQRRELLLRRLRNRGVLAVECEPARLSTSLVNHYLTVKEKSLL